MIIYISLQGLLVKGLRRRPLTAKTGVRFSYKLLLRGVAQFGRALRSGRRGRKFKSCRLDCQKAKKKNKYGLLVKGLRRRPLTAKTGVRFSYKLLCVLRKQDFFFFVRIFPRSRFFYNSLQHFLRQLHDIGERK